MTRKNKVSTYPSRQYLFSMGIFLILVLMLLAIPFFSAFSSSITQDELDLYFRDPLVTIWQETELDDYLYIGIFSQVGAVFWLMGAGFCGLTALVLKGRQHPDALMMSLLGGFGLILGLDDLLVFHDRISEEVFGYGEKHLLILYALTGLGIVIFYGRRIWQVEKVFAAALFLFAMSAIVDTSIVANILDDFMNETFYTLFEDGAKFAGIALYWWGSLDISYQLLSGNIADDT